ANELRDLGIGKLERGEVHGEKLPALFGGGPLEFLDDGGPPLQRRVQYAHPIRAQERDHPAAKAAEFVDTLDERGDRDLGLMVAVVLRARGRQRIPLVDNQNCPTAPASRVRYPLKRLRQQRSHLSHFARAANPVAQLEEDGILAAGFGNQPVCETLRRRRLPGADIAVEY